MPAQETSREAHRRSHKLLGCYLALWAWGHNVDCVILQRHELLVYLDLPNMQKARIDQLKEDVQDFFPYTSLPLYHNKTGTYLTLCFSRFPWPVKLFSYTASIETRMIQLQTCGLKTAIGSLPTENDMVMKLAQLTHGVGAFSDILAGSPHG